MPKDRRQEFEVPRYLGVAGSGSRRETAARAQRRSCYAGSHFYLLSHEDQLKGFNQKSEMIFIFTVTPWAVQRMAGGKLETWWNASQRQ